MTRIFTIIKVPDSEGDEKKVARIGLDIKIADQVTSCPISRICHSYDDMITEVEAIQNELNQILEKARAFFAGDSPGERIEITPEMSTEGIWAILSEIEEEGLFIKGFNALDEERRRAVAEHVFSRCNIFSGKAALFCARYNNASGFIE